MRILRLLCGLLISSLVSLTVHGQAVVKLVNQPTSPVKVLSASCDNDPKTGHGSCETTVKFANDGGPWKAFGVKYRLTLEDSSKVTVRQEADRSKDANGNPSGLFFNTDEQVRLPRAATIIVKDKNGNELRISSVEVSVEWVTDSKDVKTVVK